MSRILTLRDPAFLSSLAGGDGGGAVELPTTPVWDFNPENQALGDITSWVNEGSVASTSTVPNLRGPLSIVAGGAGGFKFARGEVDECLRDPVPKTTMETDGSFIGCVVRRLNNTTAPAQYLYVTDSWGDPGNRQALYVSASAEGANANKWTIWSGSTQLFGPVASDFGWHRIVGKFGASGELWVDGVQVATGNTGNHRLGAHSLNRNQGDSSTGEFDWMRLLRFSAGTTTIAEIDAYLAALYPLS